jgi:Domain of unknown function (DUF4189)
MRRATSSTAAMLALASLMFSATAALAGYGAIAWDKETGKHGWSWDEPTPQQAAAVAICNCGATGCKVIIHTGAGFCAALATTANGKVAGAAARKTENAAWVWALANCNGVKAGDCVVWVSDCNK